jgi:hypothetical protein
MTEVAYHFLIFRNPDGYIGCVPGFHFKHVPGPFDFDGRHSHAVLSLQTTVRRPEACFCLATIVVKRIGHAGRFELSEFSLVSAAYESYVVVIDTERCEKS